MFDKIICHLNEDLICDLIPNIIGKNKGKFRVPMNKKYSEKQVVLFTIDGFRNFCKNYFNSCLKKLIKRDVFSLQYVDKKVFNVESNLTDPFRIIMATMKEWCKNESQREGDIKGLVMYGYSLDNHLMQFKYPHNILYHHRNTFPERKNETVFMFNPGKKVVLLLKFAEDEDLEYEMKLSTILSNIS